MTVRKLGGVLCASLVLAVGGLILTPAPAEAQSSRSLPACDPDNGGLILPAGFCALVVADGLEGARHLDVTADGDIYVPPERLARRAEPARWRGGRAAGCRRGCRAEVVQRFSDHYGTGLQLRGDYLYLSTTTEVYRYRMTPGELVPWGAPELIVSGFPEQRGHADKAFAFDESDHLYVNVGAPSNVCMENRRPGTPGQEPCLQRRASGQRVAIRRHARRANAGVRWPPVRHRHPEHRRDRLGPRHPGDLRGAARPRRGEHALARPLQRGRECRAAVRGAVQAECRHRLGWPYCYHDRFQGHDGAGAGIRRRRTRSGPVCRRRTPAGRVPGALGAERPAVLRRPAVSSRFREGVFVVFHGSWNRAPLEQGGYKVAFAPRADGEFTGRYETFAAGFAVTSPLLSPQDAVQRPVGIAPGP